MNIKELHPLEKAVSAITIFKSELATSTALRIMTGEKLKEHTSKTRALLICIEGKAIFRDEKGTNETLLEGDFVLIEPMVSHWVEGLTTSQLLLIK